MADNQLVAKWNVHNPYEETAPQEQESFIQFYKDGSCNVPAALIGGDAESASAYLFYQAFENGTIKFEPAGAGADICFYKIEGDILCLKPISDSEYRYFAREAKKSFLKGKLVPDIAAAVKPAKEEEPEREPEEHEWKCPSCGKINQNYVGTCGCGEPKPHNKAFNWLEVHPELAKKPEPEPVPEPEPEEEPAPKKAKDVQPEREPEEHEWKCPNCGKINQNYVGTCGCGEAKPNNKLFNWAEVHPDLVKKPEPEPVPEPEPEEPAPKKAKDVPPERVPEEHEWKCPKCGKINQNYVGTCGCGEPKPHNKAFNWAEVHPDLVKKPEPEEVPVETPAPAKKQKAVKEKPAEPERVPEAHEWKCPKCGKINQNYVGTCGCGEPKPHDKPFNWQEVHPELAKKAEPEAPAPAAEAPAKAEE